MDIGAELRQVRVGKGFRQQDVADLMDGWGDGWAHAVSRMETHQRDMLVSTLDRYANALGGRLCISIAFEDGSVHVFDTTGTTCTR